MDFVDVCDFVRHLEPAGLPMMAEPMSTMKTVVLTAKMYLFMALPMQVLEAGNANQQRPVSGSER